MNITTVQVFLAFAGVTFPVLLLVPTMFTTLRPALIRPEQVAIFFFLLLCDYLLVVVAVAWSLVRCSEWVALAFLIVCSYFLAWGLRLIIHWILQESVHRYTKRLI